jgi:hypothetical protein
LREAQEDLLRHRQRITAYRRSNRRRISAMP